MEGDKGPYEMLLSKYDIWYNYHFNVLIKFNLFNSCNNYYKLQEGGKYAGPAASEGPEISQGTNTREKRGRGEERGGKINDSRQSVSNTLYSQGIARTLLDWNLNKTESYYIEILITPTISENHL